jgi:hypothetical protein
VGDIGPCTVAIGNESAIARWFEDNLYCLHSKLATDVQSNKRLVRKMGYEPATRRKREIIGLPRRGGVRAEFVIGVIESRLGTGRPGRIFVSITNHPLGSRETSSLRAGGCRMDERTTWIREHFVSGAPAP